MAKMADPPATVSQPTHELREFMRQQRARVDEALDAALPAADREPAALHAAMRHSVFAGGKRLRPLLVLAAAQACGGLGDDALPAACAFELVHTYSLIHDDLPAFDDEDLRRGKPTCHVLYGDAVAILAGDALQALAFELLARASEHSRAPERWLTVVGILGAAAGSIGMCGGQTLDIQAAGNDLDLEALRTLHAAKTGALLTGATIAGATVAGADGRQVAALRRYGNAVGLAFQIVDDLLDVEGDIATLGKRPGGDADRGQPTFPSVIGLQAAHDEAQRCRDEAVAALAELGASAQSLRDLAAYIVARSS